MLAETLGGLAFALHTLPDLERRLQAIEEWDRLYDEIGTVRHLDDTRYWPKARLAQVQLEAGDPRFAQTGEVALRCAEAEPSRRVLRDAALLQSAHALLRGDFARAEDLVMQLLAPVRGADDIDTSLTHFFVLRREQGRIAEIMEFAEAALAERPGLRALEAALVLADLEAGNELAGRERFAALTRRGISLPRDFTWSAGMFVLAEVLARLGEGGPAAGLYAERGRGHGRGGARGERSRTRATGAARRAFR